MGTGRTTGSVSRVRGFSDNYWPSPAGGPGREAGSSRFVLKTSTSKAEEIVPKGRGGAEEIRDLRLKPSQTTFPLRTAAAGSAPRGSPRRGAAAAHTNGSKSTRQTGVFIHRQSPFPITQLEASRPRRTQSLRGSRTQRGVLGTLLPPGSLPSLCSGSPFRC